MSHAIHFPADLPAPFLAACLTCGDVFLDANDWFDAAPCAGRRIVDDLPSDPDYTNGMDSAAWLKRHWDGHGTRGEREEQGGSPRGTPSTAHNSAGTGQHGRLALTKESGQSPHDAKRQAAEPVEDRPGAPADDDEIPDVVTVPHSRPTLWLHPPSSVAMVERCLAGQMEGYRGFAIHGISPEAPA